MDQFYTYLHCKPNGDPFYVGKGRRNRAYQLFDSRRSKFHMNIIRKHGAENIGIFIFPCESEDQAFADEVQQIAQLRAEGFELANFTDGGEGHSGKGHVPWNKGKKMSQPAWNKGLRGVTTAWNKGITGKASHSFGNKHTLGRKLPERERQQKSEQLRQYRAQMSQEEKELIAKKLSAANKGQVPWTKGKKNSPETIAKRVATRRRNQLARSSHEN
jgi:NUMOD3 motif